MGGRRKREEKEKKEKERRSEEHTSELQSLTTISYAVFCLKKKKGSEEPRGRAGIKMQT